MMQLQFSGLYDSLRNDSFLDCGCSLLSSPEDPYFLSRVDFWHNDQNPPDLIRENKPLSHSKSVAYHHVACKVSLRNQKEKTSIKHSNSTKCSLSQQNSQPQLLHTIDNRVKGQYYPQPRQFDYKRSDTQNWHFSAVSLSQNQIYYAQNKQIQNRTADCCPKQPEYRKQVQPVIKFTVGLPNSGVVRSQSQKMMPSRQITSTIQKNLQNQKMKICEGRSNQIGPVQNVESRLVSSPRRGKELKTKLSYQTHCSESSIIKQTYKHPCQQQELYGSFVCNHNKTSLKRTKEGHKRFNTMSDLQEVKSVVDENDQNSDKESIVLVRLHQTNGVSLFDQFQDPEASSLDK